jgi:hypothetical protein
MSKTTCLESMYKLYKAVIAVFDEIYLREKTVDDTIGRLLSTNETKGFDG